MSRSQTSRQRPNGSDAPSADDVMAALHRILASRHFPTSDKRRAFLAYVVEQALAGKAGMLKGYSIALAVLGRDESFDGQADPVVRIEARRLRRDLDCYYVEAGFNDDVRISMPKGTYVPQFEWQQRPALSSNSPLVDVEEASLSEPTLQPEAVLLSTAPTPELALKRGLERPSLRILGIAALIAIAVFAAVTAVVFKRQASPVQSADENGPSVFVQAFDGFGASDASQQIATGITHELISNLMRFPGFRLFTSPVSLGADAVTGWTDPRTDKGATYVAAGSVNVGQEAIRVSARLLDALTGQVVWAETFDRPLDPGSILEAQTLLAGRIAGAIGASYGAVNSHLNERLVPAETDMKSYICVLRAYDYRRGFARAKFDPALKCLKEAVQRDPKYSDAWAMLAWLQVDAARNGYSGHGSRSELYAKALDNAMQAERLQPNSIFPLKLLSAVHHYLRHYEASVEFARRALVLNPHDPETMAQLGWRLAARGKFDEGVPLLKSAIARTVNPPGWYYHLIIVHQYLTGDFIEMLANAERSARDGRGASQFLIAIAAGELGEQEKARKALAKMSTFRHFASDPATYMREHGVTDETVNALLAGFQKAHRTAQY